jgi:hypothetical protein
MDLAAEQLSPTRRHTMVASMCRWSFPVYVLLLAALSVHLYRHPGYEMDSINYMGNALLMEETDPAKIHQRVYAEVSRMPPGTREDFEGNRVGASPDQNSSRHERAVNAYRAAEFFPLFAIRPLYVQTLYYVSKSGLGLTRASVVISVISYFLLGLLVFYWMRIHSSALVALVMAFLVMIAPPLLLLGRENTSDALANLVAVFAIYLVFETSWLAPGLTVLLASIYFRTDNVVLAGPVLLILCWQRRLEFWQGVVLSGIAVTSALAINRLAGDYGWKMLYFRNFVGTPLAPAEIPVSFSFRDYVHAWRSGITLAAAGFSVPFLLAGIPGILLCRQLRPVAGAAIASTALHFALLPNWQERWFGVYYLVMAVCAASVTSGAGFPHSTSKPLDF